MKKQTSTTITPRKKKYTPATLIVKNRLVVNTDGTGRILPTITPAKGQEKEKDKEPTKKKRSKSDTEIVKSANFSNQQDQEQEKDTTEQDQEQDATERETDNTMIAKLAKSATENDIQVQAQVQVQEQELDQELNDNDIVDFMEKDIYYTDVGDYDIDNDDSDPTLLSVAEVMLSDFLDQEDSGSYHDKRQFHQEDKLPERMRPENRSRFDDKSTSNEPSSNESTSNNERELGDKDDREFGMFDYKEDNLIHKITDDKQEEEEIDDYYLDNESDTNTKTRINDKKKTDTIYTRSNPYMLYIEWKD